APTLGNVAVTPVIPEGTEATLTGTFTDPVVSHPHSVIVSWGDPNNSQDSSFILRPTRDPTQDHTRDLKAGDTFTSLTGDGATLTVTSANLTTGEVNFRVQHRYVDDGKAPGNGTASDTS